jgi:hypothetical protein
MRFIKTREGTLLNVNQVISISDRSKKDFTYAIAVCHGEFQSDVELAHNMSEIEYLLLPVVAAQPGFTELRFFANEEGSPWVERLPIVAWRVDEEMALPVTPDNDASDDLSYVGNGILLPDGTVLQPFIQKFPNEDEWTEAMIKLHEQRLTYKKEKKANA